MSDIINRKGTDVSTDLLGRLLSGIAKSRAQTVIPGGKPLLRMLKDGIWVYGQNDQEVQPGSAWCINVLSMQHGWCAWTRHPDPRTKNTLEGEAMASILEPKPAKPQPAGGLWPYNEQRIFDARCMTGEDVNTEVQYKNSSLGGLRAFDTLLAVLQTDIEQHPNYICPVVELFTDHYDHTKHGKIYIPILKVVDWSTMYGDLLSKANGKAAPGPAPAPAPTPAPAAATTARAPITEDLSYDPGPAPAPTAAARAPGSPRRRPVGR